MAMASPPVTSIPANHSAKARNCGQRAPLVLIFGSDDNYAMSLAVSLHSALVHLEPGCLLHLYIIDGGISDVNKKKLQRIVDVKDLDVYLEWVTPDMGLLNDLKIAGHITAATYFSLLAPDVVPSKFEKAIYLDCDIQVETNLLRLWQADVSRHALLAVRDFLIPYVSSPGGPTKFEELGLEPDTPYFNAGVLMMNLKRWRSEKISEQVFDYVRVYGEYLNFRDQEGLNVVMAGDWGMIDPRWNVTSSIFEYERWEDSVFKCEIGAMRNDLVHHPYICHFIGPNKPWHLHCEDPRKVQWRRYLKESKWLNHIDSARAPRDDIKRTQSSKKISVIPEAKVTIVIPTYNRSYLLKGCLESVLAQDYSDFNVVVLDNASSDDTEAVIKSFSDPRIIYMRNQTNIGLFGNWNRALEMNSSPYLSILPDDDAMLPGFIHDSVAALDKNQNAALSAGLAKYIDLEGVQLHLQDAGDMSEGVVEGLEYLHHIVAGPVWVIHPATVMMRSSALEAVGPFKVPHSKQLFDLNLYIRLAAHYDIFFIRKELAQVRLHSGQVKEKEFGAIEGTQPLAMIAERTDAIGLLLRSKRAADRFYNAWLADRLLSLNEERGDLTRLLVPGLHLTWTEQQQIDALKIAETIPPEEKFILIDENIRLRQSVAGRHALPFLERNGVHWGNPPDDETAIQELERMRRSGAGFIVFGWPAFWWFNYYPQFDSYLRSRFKCVLDSDRLVIFDLRAEFQPISCTRSLYEGVS